jgi:hypothetical protein
MATFERDLVCLRVHLMRKVLDWKSIWNVVTLTFAVLISWLSCGVSCHRKSLAKPRQFCTHRSQNNANLRASKAQIAVTQSHTGEPYC